MTIPLNATTAIIAPLSILPVINEANCIRICGLIIHLADSITNDEAESIMAALDRIDPTYSGHAAHIRDTLRDNTSYTLI